ncbi:hypothetical protein KDA_67350 [Dictyobacter alpinus]|uniref:Uncharacterized protein n=1 Tax=Dictyobacter alpinus TaxID=2014873 RepID=A0A402BIM0_9CHLR|nr:hypothetical protein [Dictyobacter alpinus]GCE31251.1 hypothetical protein KDA_67350 [Dictyobacter alpinus]
MGKRKVLEPHVTDWLFSCPDTMTTKQIVEFFHPSNQPVTEFSAQHWQETWQIGNDILRAYGYPKNYFYYPGQTVGWDSIADWMFVKCWKKEEKQSVKSKRSSDIFIGELIVIRDCQEDVAVNLSFFAASVQTYIRHIQSIHPLIAEKLIVVLAGWTQPVLSARIAGHSVAWALNALSE